MRLFFSIVTLLLSVTSSYGEPAPADVPAAVRVVFDASTNQPVVRDFPVSATEVVVVDDLEFELSISLQGAPFEFIRQGVPDPDVIVQLQFETSVSIMDDGPHLDLLDWKHYTSEWMVIERGDDGRFLVPDFTSEQHSRFPAVSAEELYNAVHDTGGERWSNLLRLGAGLEGPHVGVGISTIRVRFIRKAEDGAASRYVIEFPLPLGC